MLRADPKRHRAKSRIQIKVSLYVRAPSQPCNYLSIRVDIENEIANCKSLHAPSIEVKMLFPLTLDRRALSAAQIEDADWKMFPMFDRFPARGDVSTHSEAEICSDRDKRRLVIVTNLLGLLLPPRLCCSRGRTFLLILRSAVCR